MWHQLTDMLEEFTRHEIFVSHPGDLMELYQFFIKDFEARINPLRLVQVASFIANRQDLPKALEFMDTIQTKVKADAPSTIVCRSAIALINLKLGNEGKTKQLLEQSKSEIDDSIVSFEPLVHSSYYRSAIAYYKLKGPPSDYFTNALLYLSYTPLENIPVEERPQLAFDIAMAALLGDGIYNFGELLAHPIIHTLCGTQFEWMTPFLLAFNAGDIPKYQILQHTYREQIAHHAPLVNTQNREKMREKIAILCLMEIVFSRPSLERTISFQTIADATNQN
eukprot:gnl/Hemi2/12398_TR4233_c0_g1_i1.p1 gnl/Hemi2/12398_TR4233_c0_g1~~gnl/Hemi2/12398_TR4233_c0_g1_i1.p1  ORF type:complete len:324 (-),score=80.53 gnl/Hemi2/12398_TR4233_c0_g1_i1:284-1123(-)